MMGRFYLMNRLWKIIDFIDLKLSCVVLLILASLFGQLKVLLLLFFIALIHELFHLFACLLFKVEVEKLEILPFGVSLQINNQEAISSIKQIIIYLAGPMSMIVNVIWINLLFSKSIINEFTFDYLSHINKLMCFANLLIIFPLDGYMIFKGILQLFLPYKKALKVSMIVSLIMFFLFVLYNFISFQPMITIFLFLEQIKHVKDYKKLYQDFLIRKTKRKKERKYKVINDYLMYKDYNNYKFESKKVLHDNDIAIIELKKYI